MTPSAQVIKILIIAGEASGDRLGAKLMQQLHTIYTDEKVIFAGIGGQNMTNQGLHSILPLEDLAVMGYWEVITSIPRVLRALNLAKHAALQFQPDAIVTIDAPGFNFRLVKHLQQAWHGENSMPKFVHYVSPSIWAYRYKRIFTVQKLFNHILLLLPFEKKYYDAINFPSTYVGHPVVEDVLPTTSFEAIRQAYNISPTKDIVIVMPGSRRGELQKHLPILKQTMQRLRQEFPQITFFIPMVSAHVARVRSYFADLPEVMITDNAKMQAEISSIAKVALVKSGTSSVEMMHKRIPMVVGYKVSCITAWLLRHVLKLKIPYVSLCNLITNAPIIPEFLQEDFTADNLAPAVAHLLIDNTARQQQLDAFTHVLQQLGRDDNESPSHKAAAAVKAVIY